MGCVEWQEYTLDRQDEVGGKFVALWCLSPGFG
jgi:hypothetical protein